MDEDHVTLVMEMPAEALAAEAEAGFVTSAPNPIPPDPDDPEAHFIDPVSITIALTIAVLATRIVEHYLVRDGRGTLIDARQSPPLLSRLADVPEGLVLIIKPDGSTETVAAKDGAAVLADVLKSALPAGK